MTLWQKILAWFRGNAGIVTPAPVVPITVTPVKTTDPLGNTIVIPISKPVDTKTILKGIDVYSQDHEWKAYAPKIDFISIKATQGTGNVQSKYAGWRKQARDFGIPMQSYHFSEPGNGLAQAKHFISVVGDLEKGDLFPCWDWEESKVGMASIQDSLDFIHCVEDHYGVPCMVYGGLSKLSDLRLPQEFKARPFWFARPGHSILSPGPLPAPWLVCTFLQSAFAETGSASGFDEDEFLGGKLELSKWCKQ